MTSASSIGGVAVGGQKQRNMVVLLAVRYCEDNFDIGVEAIKLVAPVVFAGFEADAIHSRLQSLRFGQQIFAAAIGIGCSFVEERPCAFSHQRKSDGNVGGRTSERSVQNVCGDAHGLILTPASGEAKFCDQALLFGSFVELGCRIVFHSCLKDREHFGCGFS